MEETNKPKAEKTIAEYTDNELLSEFKEIYELINDVECYGLRDIRKQNEIENEIYKRGYKIKLVPTLIKSNQ